MNTDLFYIQGVFYRGECILQKHAVSHSNSFFIAISFGFRFSVSRPPFQLPNSQEK